MKDLLVVYPHGLGDCILLTPAIREFHRITGHKVHIATLERFRSARFFYNNPHVDEIYFTKDPWHDYENERVGFPALYNEWKTIAQKNYMGGLVMPMHHRPESKIALNFQYLGIRGNHNIKTEFHTTHDDVEIANNIIRDLVGDKDFGFIQTYAGFKPKDLPENFGREWLAQNKGLENFIEIGKDLDAFSCNINVQFEILRRSSAVCLTDSVFYHACHAMDKEVDYAYFARGESVYNRVRPLHEVKEHVTYKI